jgi:hypothetical protein
MDNNKRGRTDRQKIPGTIIAGTTLEEIRQEMLELTLGNTLRIDLEVTLKIPLEITLEVTLKTALTTARKKEGNRIGSIRVSIK